VLNGPGGASSSGGQLATALGGVLQQLGQHTDHLLNVRAQVGSRLATLDDTDSARQDQDVELKSSIAKLRDVDYATAVTQMNQQLLGLQAAQQSYLKISQLSLFNYL
jgi:flagellar hook-associated protein 3 FlgL